MDCLKVSSAAFVLSLTLDFNDPLWNIAILLLSLDRMPAEQDGSNARSTVGTSEDYI